MKTISIKEKTVQLVIERTALGNKRDEIDDPDGVSNEVGKQIAELDKQIAGIEENLYFALHDALRITEADVAEYWRLQEDAA